MERLSGSASKKGTKNHQDKKICLDLEGGLSDFFSQMQMMSDSLAACSQMPRYRPVRKMVNASERIGGHLLPGAQSSVQIILSAEEKTLEGKPSDGGENAIVSYTPKPSKKEKNSQKSRGFGSREEFLSKSNSDAGLGSGRFRGKLENLISSSGEFRDLNKRSSKVGMYEPGNVTPRRMIDVIQRELKTLTKLTPSLAPLLTSMSDTVSHYKGCSRCRDKTFPAFPWILNRLQKLIKFIVTKRHRTYSWPNDHSYLRLVPDEPTISEPEEKSGFERYNLGSCPEELILQLGQLEKVDAFAVSEDHPGVQILLEVKPGLEEKRFFCKIDRTFQDNSCGGFPVTLLEEPSEIPVFIAVRPKPQPRVCWIEKRVLSSPKLLSYLFFLRFELPLRVSKSVLQYILYNSIFEITTESESEEEEEVLPLLSQTNIRQESKVISQSAKPKDKSNEKNSFVPKNILKNVSDLVFDFLKEAEEEKMQIRKVKELESDLKELKELLTDVHKNQAELSKVLLKKGIYSRLIIKFTDPEMLQEEDWAVNKVAEIKLHKTRTSSLEALQKTVGDLKRKCNLKNRMIMTLLKGFQSNVPKELWEEILNAMFDESMEENLDPEKVSEFIRQTSFFLMNGEQASRTLLPITRLDEQPLKEEPIMKGNMGADIQDNLKILSDLDDKLTKIMDDTLMPLECQYPMRISAYPAVVSENLTSSIRKLEYQVSILNVENERLWHEILELRDVLKNSVKGLSEKMSERASDKQLSSAPKSSPKTINVTIQIASDKDHRLSKDSGVLKITRVNETVPKTSAGGSSKGNTDSDTFSKANEEPIQSPKLGVFATGSKLPSKSERRRWKSEFNYLDELIATPSTISYYRHDEEKLKGLLRERAFGRALNPPVEQATAQNPHPSEHGLWKNLQAVPSVHVVNEAITGYQAGPSRRRLDIDDSLQSPSLMELTEGKSDGMSLSVSKERELHPIPEDDNLDPRSSGSINEAIQRLRARVRSIHKDVTVLKSKNDRIDKVLNRLVEDIKSNNESFEEIQKSLYLNNTRK